MVFCMLWTLCMCELWYWVLLYRISGLYNLFIDTIFVYVFFVTVLSFQKCYNLYKLDFNNIYTTSRSRLTIFGNLPSNIFLFLIKWTVLYILRNIVYTNIT